MSSSCDADWRTASFSFYRYAPSLVAAIIFCVLFFASTALHLFQMCKTKTWYLTPLVVGCLFEFIGFSSRASSATQHVGCWTLTPYLIQNMFILLAPALFAASIYMILGRIILLVDGEAHAIIKRRWLTKVFVSGDVVCFLLLAGGGGIVATAKEDKAKADAGNNIIIGGLVVQLLWFVFFVIVAAIFQRRLSLLPTDRSTNPTIRWQSYLTTLYVASTLIVIRSVFRVAEYVQGHSGYLLSNEAFLYVFDALPMLIVVSWLHWRHPGEIGLLLRDEKADTAGLRLVHFRASSKSSTVQETA